jgi:hypothetical protein
MKKIVLIAAMVLPWGVFDSTYTYKCDPIPGTDYFACPIQHRYYLTYKGDRYMNMELNFEDKDQANDMAEALNEAHERRIIRRDLDAGKSLHHKICETINGADACKDIP